MLPEASILQKLQMHHADAALIVMDKAQALSAQRRAEETAQLAESFKKAAKKRFFFIPALLACFDYARMAPQNTRHNTSDNIFHIGDSIRQAIHLYMAEHNLTERSLNLNETERNSLILRYPAPAPAEKQEKTGFFRKIFPKL